MALGAVSEEADGLASPVAAGDISICTGAGGWHTGACGWEPAGCNEPLVQNSRLTSSPPTNLEEIPRKYQAYHT